MYLRSIKTQFEGHGQKAMLLRGGVGSLLLKIGGTLLSLLMAVVLARTLGADGYGVYAYVFALVSLLAIPAQVGLPTIVVRETARAQINERWDLMRGLWLWSTSVIAGMTGVLVSIALVVVWLIADRFSADQLRAFYYGLLLVPLVSLGNQRGAALSGLRKVVKGQLPETVIRPGLLVLMLLVVHVLLGHEMTPAAAMGFHAMASALAFGMGAWLLWQVRPDPLKAKPLPKYEVAYWLKATVPLAIVAGINVINAQVDILILGWYRSAEDVGIYRVVVSSVGLVVFGLNAIQGVAAPYFARLHSQRDFVRLQQLVTMTSRLGLLLALPVFVTFVLVGGELLGFVFGPEFSSGYLALVILTVGNIVNVALGSVMTLLNMSGHERETAKAVVIVTTINCALNIVLIPLFGIEGAALGTILALMTLKIILWRVVHRKLGIVCGVRGPK